MPPFPPTALLVLLRHGESTANASGLFTGVLDVPLSDAGRREAAAAAVLLHDGGLVPDVVVTSEFRRTIATADVLEASGVLHGAPRLRDWRLDERSYGALMGRTKEDVCAEVGPEQFRIWRRSVDVPPPPMDDAQHAALAATDLFRSLPPEALPRTESLRDVVARIAAFHEEVVVPRLGAGERVLVVGHGNSLRAYCLLLDDLDDEEVRQLNLPTAHPLVYTFDESGRPSPRGGRYLDPDGALEAAALVASQGGT